MSKILISNLGVGKKEDNGYRTIEYSFGGSTHREASVAKVLAESLKIDSLVLFGTSGSIWDWVYDSFGGGDEEVSLHLYEAKSTSSVTKDDLGVIELQISSYLKSSDPSRCILIEYGKDEAELLSNFSRFLELSAIIKDGDTVYLDITHSFRSLAFMSYVMIDYLKSIGVNCIIGGIYYGMIEVNDEAKPIVDLRQLYNFGEWSKAITYLKKSGNPNQIADLIQCKRDDCIQLTKEYREFGNAFSLSYLAAIKERIPTFLSSRIPFENPLYNQLDIELKSVFSKLNAENEWTFALNVAKFYYETQNYGMSYLVLQSSLEAKIKHYEERASFDYHELCRIACDKPWKKAFDLIRTLKRFRNNIAHFIPGEITSVSSTINNLRKYLDKAEKLLSENWHEA